MIKLCLRVSFECCSLGLTSGTIMLQEGVKSSFLQVRKVKLFKYNEYYLKEIKEREYGMQGFRHQGKGD